MTDILQFQDEYRWLSNHWPSIIVFQGITFPTVEHAYVYSKTIVQEEQDLFLQAQPMSAAQAKRAGKLLTLRSDWEDVRLNFMLDFTRQKYRNQVLRNKLIDTGNCLIVEGNTWHDYFWGQCNGKGENNLGKIIMKVREELIGDEYERINSQLRAERFSN